MKIGIDIDNVIANTFAELIPYFNRFMGKEFTPPEVIETMRREKGKMLLYYLSAWRNRAMITLSLIDGAAETIRHWHPQHQIKLITSRLPLFNRQTKEWLKKHQIPYHELHHAAERTKYTKAKGCAVFIEDNPAECEVLADHCERVFLFNHPWNSHSTAKKNIIRVKDWAEIRSHF
jgi:uncharacterized HAD superfamily protein